MPSLAEEINIGEHVQGAPPFLSQWQQTGKCDYRKCLDEHSLVWQTVKALWQNGQERTNTESVWLYWGIVSTFIQAFHILLGTSWLSVTRAVISLRSHHIRERQLSAACSAPAGSSSATRKNCSKDQRFMLGLTIGVYFPHSASKSFKAYRVRWSHCESSWRPEEPGGVMCQLVSVITSLTLTLGPLLFSDSQDSTAGPISNTQLPQDRCDPGIDLTLCQSWRWQWGEIDLNCAT